VRERREREGERGKEREGERGRERERELMFGDQQAHLLADIIQAQVRVPALLRKRSMHMKCTAAQ
jgi:hypothetical protein